MPQMAVARGNWNLGNHVLTLMGFCSVRWPKVVRWSLFTSRSWGSSGLPVTGSRGSTWSWQPSGLPHYSDQLHTGTPKLEDVAKLHLKEELEKLARYINGKWQSDFQEKSRKLFPPAMWSVRSMAQGDCLGTVVATKGTGLGHWVPHRAFARCCAKVTMHN